MKWPVQVGIVGLGVEALVERHPTVLRVLILVAIFGSGYFDAAVLKARNLACATWFLGLGALTAWIAYPWTPFRICAGAVVFLSGLLLMVAYYRGGAVRNSWR